MQLLFSSLFVLLLLNPGEEKAAQILLTWLGIEQYLFPKAAVTNYQKLLDLKQLSFIIVLEVRSSK